MKRLILVSFAFLAFVFYELSGGADFQPRVAVVPPESQAATQTSVATATPVNRTRQVEAATLVASPAIAPPSVAPARSDIVATTEPAAPAPTDVVAQAETDLEAATKLDQIRNSLNQGLSLFPDSDPIAQPLMLASLEQGAAGLSVAPPDPNEPETSEPSFLAPPPTDLREITGTRVNMRDGPGTIYPVILRLTIGHEVEVLDESGTGWLRLRTLPEKQIGWISASLVSKAKP